VDDSRQEILAFEVLITVAKPNSSVDNTSWVMSASFPNFSQKIRQIMTLLPLSVNYHFVTGK
jgi:hypothetical protein